MLSLRQRNADDQRRVVAWIPDAAALFMFTGPRLSWPLNPDQLLAMESDLLGAWMVIDEENNEPVGHFDLRTDNCTAWLGRVLINPSQRGRGLSHVLIRLAIEQARTLGVRQLRLNVIVGNERAISTYERAGFTEIPQSGRADLRVMALSL